MEKVEVNREVLEALAESKANICGGDGRMPCYEQDSNSYGVCAHALYDDCIARQREALGLKGKSSQQDTQIDGKPCIADYFLLERMDKILNCLQADYDLLRGHNYDSMQRKALDGLLEELGIKEQEYDYNLLVETAGKHRKEGKQEATDAD